MKGMVKGKVKIVEIQYDRAFSEESVAETMANMFGEGGWVDSFQKGWVQGGIAFSGDFRIEIDQELGMVLFFVDNHAEFLRAKKLVEETLEYEE